MLMSSLAALLLTATAACDSAARCNRIGTEAYQAGEYLNAAEHFSRQVDFVETTLREHQGEPDARLLSALDLALNNAALAWLRAGSCLKAAAWLDLARADARATVTNRRLLDSLCERAAGIAGPVGEYWQYAGHGQWNRISIRETGDETLRLDAFWMRIGRGPLDLYGIAAFGELEGVHLHPDGMTARGRFESWDPDIECWVQLSFEPQALLIDVGSDPACQTGGMGAVLNGHYRLVSTDPGELPGIVEGPP